MPHFSKSVLANPALTSRALAFSPLLPVSVEARTRLEPDGPALPPAVTVLPNGDADVRFYAPKAEKAALRLCDGRVFPLQPEGGGFWAGTVPYTPGFQYFNLLLDGVEALSPMAPVGYGYSSAGNYIEFPEEGCEFYLLQDVPHGLVVQDLYFSTVTGRYESCMIYLPPDYLDSQRRYPVLYLQHGHGENEKCWVYYGKVNLIMDNLLAQGKAEPCIIVMNDGMVQTKGPDGAPMMDAALLPRVLTEDCIPFIERRYRTLTDREHRAMAGLSMGSMQTSMTVMERPDLFAWAGIFSGFLRSLANTGADDRHMLALDEPDFPERYKLFWRAIGVNDDYRPIFERESALLAEKGLAPEQWPAHKIVLYPGRHEWQVWRKCARDFLQLIFR